MSPTSRVIALPARNVGMTNSPGFTSGDPPRRTRRRSWATNAPNTGTAAARTTKIHAGHPATRPWMSGNINRNATAARPIAPGTSRRPSASGSRSGMMRAATNHSAAAGTTKGRNPHRHPSPSGSAAISPPPVSCPRLNDAPAAVRYTVNARVRAWPRKVRWITAESCGVMSPPESPWSTRAASSTPMVGASACIAIATTNPALPRSSSRRVP